MSTSALVMIVITWAFVLFMVIYFFSKVIRKELENRARTPTIPSETTISNEHSQEKKETPAAEKLL